MDNQLSCKLLFIFDEKINNYIKVLNTKIEILELFDMKIILTSNSIVEKNNYIVSPFNLLIGYGKEEIFKIKNKIEQKFYLLLLFFLSLVLKLFKIDKNIYVNNILLSTNFFSKKWNNLDLKELLLLEENLLKKSKKHAFILRSINKYSNNNLLKLLEKQNWEKIVSRQVYILKNKNKVLKSHNFKIDKKLLNSKRYVFKDVLLGNLQQYKEVISLYENLYIDKYSIENIQFTYEYVKELHLSNLIHLKFLYDNLTNKNVGVIGIIGNNEILTAPIVGYNIAIDKKEAIYRRIIIYIINYSIKENIVLNLSSGAPYFKELRGLEPELEFTFVKTNHLPLYRRFIWKFLSWFSINIYGKMLIRLKL